MSNTAMFTATMIPLIVSRNSHTTGCECEPLGIFGSIFVTIVCMGIIAICVFMAIDMKDKFSIFFASFSSIVIFLTWCGIIFGLR